MEGQERSACEDAVERPCKPMGLFISSDVPEGTLFTLVSILIDLSELSEETLVRGSGPDCVRT